MNRQLASKWLKTNVMLANPYIARHIPASRIFSSANLRSMLGSYSMLVLKPVCGAGGLGVMKVTRNNGSYSCTYMSRTVHRTSFNGLLNEVNRLRHGRRYLIQRGIQLATIGGRPIDYRVKYVKSNGQWHYRSMVGRLARRGLFVTNLCRGGTIMTAAQGIRRSLSARLISVKKQQMRQLTKVSTNLLESRFPGIGQLGYDYGIDHNGHIWILEVNTRPQ
ncbi:MAG: YheC/YheD family protein [Candidatus Cohnella colombiensis]|uniref:YheC/YheD family protein n=1 Tax=Candidatus Cohnella colombiensis TaxID=3121368 RepID=A0AA95EVA9_9BACL|nr:MAG: YheC/YheD family protein [Cohnella sp.]